MERKVVCLRPISNSINEYYPNKFQIVLLASFDIDSLRFDEVGYVSSFSINGFRYVYSTLVIDENEKTPSGYFLESLILTKKKEKRLNIEKKTVSSKDIWNNRFRGLLFPDPEELVTLEYENRILTNDFKIWYKSLKKESVDENTRDSILIDGIEIIENSAEISINKKRFWVNQNGQDVESNYNAGLLFYQLHCNYLFSLFSSENLLTNEIQNTIADIAEYISYYDDSIIENFAGEFANGNLLYNYDTFFNVNLYRNFIKNPENKYRFPDIDNVEYSEYIKEKTKQHYETVRTATYFLIYDVYILKRIVDEASDEGQVKDFDYFIGVLSLIPTELLYEVSPELKIAVIAHIACKKMSNWFNKGFYEEIVIKICSSFAQTDYVNINDFLSRLLSTEIRITSSLFGYEFYNTKQTLYENLYNNMSQSWNITRSIYGLSNYVAGTNYQPIDTKGAFAQTIYLLWQFSKYCPYDIFTGELRPGVIGFKNIPNAFTRDETGDFVLDDNNQKVPISDFTYDENAPENQTLFKYTHEVGYYRKIDESIYTPYDGFEKEDYALECAPLMISYESQKSLGVYVNNMEIKFFDKKIKVEKSENVYRAINTGSEEDEEQNNDKYFTYGVYDIYQPIGLISPEKIVDSKVEVLTVDGEEVNAGGGLNVNSFIPTFVLKYIDDANDRDATETLIGYSVDLALTLSGVGNIAKLRYLRYGTGVAEGIGLFSRQGVKIAIGSLDFTVGVLGFLANLTECTPPTVEETHPDYPQQKENYKFCMAMKGFVTALQIASLSANAVDGLASLALYSKARKVCLIAGGTDEVSYVQNIKDKLATLNSSSTNSLRQEVAEVIYRSQAQLNAGAPLNLIAELVRVFLNRLPDEILKQNKLYKLVPDTELNLPVKKNKAPRFSLFKYEAVDANHIKRVSEGTDFLHTEGQLQNIYNQGKNTYQLNEKIIDGFVLRSYRSAKQKKEADILDQLMYYKEYKVDRNGLLYCFNDLAHQNSGFSSISQILNNFDTDGVKLTDYLTEFKISGSVQYKPNPPDLDMTGGLTQNEIKQLLNHYESLIGKYAKDAGWKEERIIEIMNRLAFYKTKIRRGDTPQIPADLIIRVERFEIGNTGRYHANIYSLKDDLTSFTRTTDSPILTEVRPDRKIDFNIFENVPERDLEPTIIINIQ